MRTASSNLHRQRFSGLLTIACSFSRYTVTVAGWPELYSLQAIYEFSLLLYLRVRYGAYLVPFCKRSYSDRDADRPHTAWCRVFIVKFIIAQLVERFSAFDPRLTAKQATVN